ncbi:unnamed protein product [Heterobilharzia americana]|nr:unnamed protein product [Heterobilharzia americana]
MIIGEDRQKIKRLVSGENRLSEFRSLYKTTLHSLESYGFSFEQPLKSYPNKLELNRLVSFNVKSEIIPQLLTNIPDYVCLLSVKDVHINNPIEAREFLSYLSPIERSQRLYTTVSSIVRKSSLYQTGLGVISAGPQRSLKYAFAKLGKMFASFKSAK